MDGTDALEHGKQVAAYRKKVHPETALTAETGRLAELCSLGMLDADDLGDDIAGAAGLGGLEVAVAHQGEAIPLFTDDAVEHVFLLGKTGEHDVGHGERGGGVEHQLVDAALDEGVHAGAVGGDGDGVTVGYSGSHFVEELDVVHRKGFGLFLSFSHILMGCNARMSVGLSAKISIMIDIWAIGWGRL